MRRACFLSCFALLTCVWGAGGCAQGKFYRLGREAENRGDVSLAYDYYAQAVRQYPDDDTYSAALRRVAPTAATYWDSEARIAYSQGRYADSWRMAMRCLEIHPAHRGMVTLVRQLEEQSPMEVATARRDWLRRGSGTLASAVPDDNLQSIVAPDHPQKKSRIDLGEKVASRSSDHTPITDLPKDPPPKTLPPVVQTPSSRPAIPPSPKIAQATKKPPKSAPFRNKQHKKAALSEEKKIARPTTNAAKAVEPPSVGITNIVPVREKEDHPPAAGRQGEFLAVRVLSKREKRYKRRVLAVDGISIRLRDTDSDPDVDLDLYEGNRRIQKIRDLKIGRSKLFRGRTGKWYRLTILDIKHSTHTVRVGIKPA